MRMNPIFSLFRFIWLIVSGRLYFPQDRLGEEVFMNDSGPKFTVFRHAVIKEASSKPEEAGAQLVVRFRLAKMSPELNTKFSMILIPFFVGLPGFKSKLWMVNKETGHFQGLYEWKTVLDAKNYSESFAMKFMTRRVEPGSIAFRITSKE